MLRVLVLGSEGFIGKHLIAALSKRHDVKLTIFDRNSSFKTRNDLRYIQGDFEDSVDLKEAVKEQDIVYHLISQTIPSLSWDNPFLEIEKNLTPSLKLIELASESKVKKICFASSGGTVYGVGQSLFTEESPTEPFSPYGIIKRSIESFLQYAKLKYQINYDIFRISNAYGGGQDVGKGLGFINTALENIVYNRPVLVYGDGKNIRDYIYIKDIAKLLMLSISKNSTDSDIYNVSSNHSVSLNEVIALLKKITEVH